MQAWGKLNESGDSHPLVAHMLDVAACFYACMQIDGIMRAMERVAKRPLSNLDVMRLCVLVFLHDVGKANAGFQAKRWSRMPGQAPAYWPAPAGHTNEALSLFDEKHGSLLSELPLEAMQDWGAASCLNLWRASISHHGNPVEQPIQIDPQIWQPVQQGNGQLVYDPRMALREMGKCLTAWFRPAFESGPELPDSPEFAHLFAGMVQFSDWLGSNTDFFPYAQAGEMRHEWVWQRASEAVQTIGLDTRRWRDVLPSLPNFSNVFAGSTHQPMQPRPIQQKMSEADLGPLLILESETGSGKTEAALWRFAQLFQMGKVDSLYFALPSRVAATQLYERVLKFAGNLWQDTGVGPPLVVRALAGYESADGQTMLARHAALPRFEVLWADNPDEQTAHQRWAAESSKRYLAAPLAVGTIDQALMAALQVRHAHMRHSLLCRSLLVVDEVHASDAYMSRLLQHLLKAHIHAGGHALLLSATLGSSARHLYQQLTAPAQMRPDLAQAIAHPYPALTDGLRIHSLSDSGRSKRVHWQPQYCIDSPNTIAALVIEAAAQGAKILVIRNTVPTALATFRAIEELAQQHGLASALFNLNGIATVHHSRYSRQDRPLLDAAVEQQIGKHRTQPMQARVIVGTQTLEQSLDIDADLLITDLCPMDVLLQRVGRLHRHERPAHERPAPYQHAQAIVLLPQDRHLDSYLKKSQHGLGRFQKGGGIYLDLRILEATRRLISEANSHLIPQDNRMLVEQATHPDALQLIEQELGSDWLIHGQSVQGELQAQKGMAGIHQLPFDKCFEDELGNSLTFPSGGEQKIGSRLGAATYLLTFDPPQPGPFGQAVQHLPVRHHMWPAGLSADEQPKVQSATTDEGFTFMLGTQTYRYSRVGLERLTDTAATEATP